LNSVIDFVLAAVKRELPSSLAKPLMCSSWFYAKLKRCVSRLSQIFHSHSTTVVKFDFL
jgi:hypothetical protein